jgi:glycyl-tRNA synthetase beta chain
MPELFLELFSEEIPARMQERGAAALESLVTGMLQDLLPLQVKTFFGPRRIALITEVQPMVLSVTTYSRGPRRDAPQLAVDGFLRKFGLTAENLTDDDPLAQVVEGYWRVTVKSPERTARARVAEELPGCLRHFPWPKSMRWGGTSNFVWVRPLRRMVCLLDGEVVPFDLRDGADDGHGLASGNLTEGHRFHALGAFAVTSAAQWQQELLAHRVMVDAADRKRVIADRIAGLAAEKSLTVVDDPGLLEEVAGLVEWPVPHLGRIADEHMDLPPEVMQTSMRVNQRYFALRAADGAAAPWFAFVANIQAEDDGAAIIAGNERVLKARFSDARHFWDLDRENSLEDRVPLLDRVTYHAKLGSQGERARRLRLLAEAIAPVVGAEPELASRAAALSKADLVSGMVSEFPELQGVMGGYYARHDHEDGRVADAIRDHYAPRGPTDAVPSRPVSIAVALADKLDQLTGFFAIGEKPTGSGDPYALRRAALGVIRIIRENGLRVRLRWLLAATEADAAIVQAVFEFIVERLVVQLRTDGARYDVLNAVFAAKGLDRDDDLVALLARTEAVAALLGTPDGANLLTAYRRAANILRIEERKDGPFGDAPDPSLYREAAEIELGQALSACGVVIDLLNDEAYGPAMSTMAGLRAPLDLFFEKVTVNATEPDLRRNRLRLLSRVRSMMDQIADFSRIEG